jgi:hypothetical protein
MSKFFYSKLIKYDSDVAKSFKESFKEEFFLLTQKRNNGILLPKLFCPTVRKNCSSDREKLLKFEAESREFAQFLRSLEQFIQTVKVQNNFG